MVAFEVQLCEVEGIALSLMGLVFDTFAESSPLMNVMQPHNETPTGIEKARQKYVQLLKTDYSQRWTKVVDSENGKIVGVAQWNVYDGAMPPEIDFGWPSWDLGYPG